MRDACVRSLLLITFAAALGAPVSAAVVEKPVPLFQGAYGTGKSVDVDVGTSFTSIDNVSIRWSGSVTAGWHTSVEIPGPDPGSFLMEAKDDIGQSVAVARTGWLGSSTYPNAELFNFQNGLVLGSGNTWTFLLDGRARLAVTLEHPVHWFSDQDVVRWPWPPHNAQATGVLESCVLVVDGTPVPEPSIVLAIGTIAVLARRRQSS